MNKLGYSYLISERNADKLNSLNASIQALMNLNETLKKFKKIEFEVEGCYLESDLKLVVNFETCNGYSGKEVFSSHVDEGAIDLSHDYIIAFFGEEKYNAIKKKLEKNYGVFESDYLKKNEPELYNQLAEDYLLMCTPDVDNGAEFTEEDENFFKELLNKKKQ